MTSVLVVEDHELLANAVARVLRERCNFEVVAVVGTAESALQELPGATVDVVLVDVSLPGMSGIELVSVIKEKYPGLPCLMLSGHASARYVDRSLEVGASGYVLKDDIAGILLGIELALRGETYVSKELGGSE
jgi:DNA-binding NarL/FixJ family response regulator